MSQDLKKYLIDHSTPDEFCFALGCAECGRELRKSPVRFSKSGVVPPSSEKRIVFDVLYQREKESAVERAAAELKTQINMCPVCHRMVCDRCFLICDELDMCIRCAEQLHEEGEPVLA